MGKSTEPLKTRQYVTAETLTNIGKLFQDWASEKAQSEGLTGHHQMPAEEQRSGGMRSGAHGGLICPLEKGVRGIETSGSGYLRQQIRGGRKGRAERQGLGQSPNKITRLGELR